MRIDIHDEGNHFAEQTRVYVEFRVFSVLVNRSDVVRHATVRLSRAPIEVRSGIARSSSGVPRKTPFSQTGSVGPSRSDTRTESGLSASPLATASTTAATCSAASRAGSPTTTMVANGIEFYLLGGSRKQVGASLVLLLSGLLLILMAYYLVSTHRAERAVAR